MDQMVQFAHYCGHERSSENVGAASGAGSAGTSCSRQVPKFSVTALRSAQEPVARAITISTAARIQSNAPTLPVGVTI